MIIEQCVSCHEKGKKYYCNNCLKSPDFFDVYQYKNVQNRFDKGRLIWRLKAYTWHDATDYVKNRFFADVSKQTLNINCEKDFVYIEGNSSQYPAVDIKEGQGNFVGYKIYLNKEWNGSDTSWMGKDQNFSDLTTGSSGVINSYNKNINSSAAAHNTYNNKQQQTIADAIKRSPKKELTPNTPTMITKLAKQDEEEEQNSLRNKMS
jgi:hypothetical protein